MEEKDIFTQSDEATEAAMKALMAYRDWERKIKAAYGFEGEVDFFELTTKDMKKGVSLKRKWWVTQKRAHALNIKIDNYLGR